MEKKTQAEKQSESRQGLKETLQFLEGEGKQETMTARADAGDPGGVKKTKTRKYKERECPYCNKVVRNLPNHIAQAHPGELPKKEPETVTKEKLLGVPVTEPKTETPRETAIKDVRTTYYCNDCRAELRKGESTCWKCGKTMNWEGIE